MLADYSLLLQQNDRIHNWKRIRIKHSDLGDYELEILIDGARRQGWKEWQRSTTELSVTSDTGLTLMPDGHTVENNDAGLTFPDIPVFT
jgi:hypothetical protein